jgi:glycosyltransferase involved in cell wall biosynthesis
MHILIMNWRDIKHPRAGGAEIVTFEHAKRWVKKGHAVTWITSGYCGARDEEIIEGIRIIRRGGSFTVYLFAPLYYLLHAREFSIIVDEIHGLPFFTPLYSLKPKVAFIHEIAKEIWEYTMPFPLSVIGRGLESMYLFLYRNIPFWTDARSIVDDLVREGVPRNHCVAIPCPVSNPIVTSFPRKERTPTFLYVSRLVKMKGIEDVLTSFSKIIHTLPSSKLWIVGEGYGVYTNQLKKQVHTLGLDGRVVFWGKVSQSKKLELMRKAHVLLHASIREGWGLVVLEAASQGTPAVVYNVQGLRDVVCGGKAGIIVRENTPLSMADDAIALYKNKGKYHRMQTSALRWARSLTWEDVSTESLHMLERIFEEK